MMKLKLVKDKSVDEDAVAANGNLPAEYQNHGTMVLKELVEPWAGRGDRVVAVDSYFAQVQQTQLYSGLTKYR